MNEPEKLTELVPIDEKKQLRGGKRGGKKEEVEKRIMEEKDLRKKL